MKTIDKNAVKIRRMVSSDVAPTLDIWWADIPEKNMVASELLGPLDLSQIAEYEGILAGFLLAKLEYTGHPMTGAAMIYLISVNPDYRKHGIGTLLIEALARDCQSKIIKTIRASIPENNAAITRYFTDAGFRRSNVVNFDKVEPAGK
jgi:ribosomal protein S18 acetylase RimI-like enzyme